MEVDGQVPLRIRIPWPTGLAEFLPFTFSSLAPVSFLYLSLFVVESIDVSLIDAAYRSPLLPTFNAGR